MSEIVCQSCGARNPTQSKYCNKCGADLRSGTSQICPGCEKSNPIELLYCDHCGTLLAEDALMDAGGEENDEEPAPESRSEPFSLPARPPGQTGNLDVSGEVPAWLRTGDVDQDANEAPDEDTPGWLEAAQGSKEQEWEDDEAPTLDELSGSHAPSDDLPTWLLEDEAGHAIFNSEKDTNELFNEGNAQREAEDEDDGDDTQEELPDWLEGLSSPGTGPLPFLPDDDSEQPLEAAAEAPAADQGQEDETTSELQSWLSAMEEDESSEPSEPSSREQPDKEVPQPEADWLQEFEAGPGEQGSDGLEIAANVEDDFARWLTGEEVEEGTADAAPEGVQSLDEEDFLEWLSDARQEDLDIESIGAESATPAEEGGAEAAPDDAAQEAPDNDPPDWLEMSDEELLVDDDEAASPDTESAAAPDWLAEFEEDALEVVDEPLLEEDDEALWAPAEQADADADHQAGDAAGEEMTEEDFLGWLATLDEGGPEATLDAEQAAGAAEDKPPEELFLSEEDVDADSQPERGGEEQLPQEMTGDEPSPELPSWLGELADRDDVAVEADDELAGEFPEWLQSMPSIGKTGQLPYLETEEEETAEPQAEGADGAPEPAPEAKVEGEEGEEDVPEWLSGVSAEFELEAHETKEGGQPPATEQAPAPDESRSEERQEQEAIAPDEFEFADAALDPDAGDNLVPTEDLPDWFSDVMADIEMESASDSGLSGEGELANVPPQLAADDLPEWLDSPFAEAPDAEPTPLEEIPEWLQPPPGAAQDAPVTDEELLSLGAAESSDEWSDLLDALPPPEQDSESLSEADIPEWLQALKPQALREGSEETPAPPAPEEKEGPLAGLRGVIGVAPAMAQPRQAERIDPDLSAAEHEQQVALLRQLARSESQTAMAPVLPALAKAPSPVTRVLLALLLLVTLIIGLFFADTIAQLAPWVAPENTAQAASVIDAAAGDPVVVAFEYTPALSGALDNDARAVLARLADNGSTALLVSQSAAGATLARQAASEVPELQSADVGYIPGGAAGLRSLARCLEDDRACDSLFGRPLAQDEGAALRDTALLIVLSGDRGQLLDWVEQVQTVTELSMVAFVTEAIAPVAAPYVSSRQLTAVSSNGSAQLDPAAQTMTPQGAAVLLGRWLAVAAILLGAIYYLVTGRSGKRQRQTDE